jgi:hypothetical protein
MTTPKQDCEALMNAVLPFGKQLPLRTRELLPFGGTMSAFGEVAQVAGWTGDERPPSRQIIALLNGGFRDGAALGKYRATALVYDIRVVPPGSTEKQDAIAVNLDHRDGYSVVVVFPYTISDLGALVLGPPFAKAGAAVIFNQ